MQNLSSFDVKGFQRGRSYFFEFTWILFNCLLFQSPFFKLYNLKRYILNSFGSRVAFGFVCKPGVKITFPWKFKSGHNCWVGEDVWINNLDYVTLGNNVCISQRTYLCTGSHNWSKTNFDLLVSPISIGSGSWICADVFIAPGVTIGENTVVTAGSVVTNNLPPNMVCSGNPCIPIKSRLFNNKD